MRTMHLRQQHQDLLRIVGQIVPLLKPDTLDQTHGDALRKLLLELTGKLNMHLAAEDKVLYPELAASTQARVSATAAQFAKEMGHIGGAYKEYLGKYPNGTAISNQAKAFCADTSAVFTLLGKRIQREESELYPLADSLSI